MDMGTTIAAAALTVSVGSAVYGRRAWLASDRQARAAEVQARLATQQEAERQAAKRRALIRAEMHRDAHSGAVILYNEGEAPALDVRVSVTADTARPRKSPPSCLPCAAAEAPRAGDIERATAVDR